jgi:hypothetical protein
MASCFNVLASECVGNLPSWTAARKAAVGAKLQQYQSPNSGQFVLPDVRVADLRYPHVCDRVYLNLQFTYFALAALHALESAPLHALYFAHPALNSEYALGWIDGGPWQDPWNHSNRIMFLLRFLIHLHQIENKSSALFVFDRVLDRLDSLQSPRTGLWHGIHDATDRLAVFAAYHFFPFYAWRARSIHHPERIVECALSIQNDDSLFGFEPGGGACEDLDAIDVLALLVRAAPHRQAAVRAGLRRALLAIVDLQRPDGGFPNYLYNPIPFRRLATPAGLRELSEDLFAFARSVRAHGRVPPRRYRPYYYSGWRRLEGVKGESDVWGSWFRTLAIVTILRNYPEFGSLPAECRFHGLPALGWHPI